MSEEIKGKIRTYVEKLDKGNLNVIDKFFDPDVTIHMAPNPDMNLELYKQFVRGLYSAFPDLQFVNEEMIVEGDSSAFRYTAQGTHKGEFMGIAPTDKQVTWAGCEVAHWEGGKIVEGWWYADALGMMLQMGVIPTPGQ
jgi:predicted ester cyclase